MKGTKDYKEYTKLSRELQRVPVEKLDQDGRKAFFINIYNAMVIHSTVENGPPTNWLSRFKVKAISSLMFLVDSTWKHFR